MHLDKNYFSFTYYMYKKIMIVSWFLFLKSHLTNYRPLHCDHLFGVMLSDKLLISH
jgi:hypothetical protein